MKAVIKLVVILIGVFAATILSAKKTERQQAARKNTKGKDKIVIVDKSKDAAVKRKVVKVVTRTCSRCGKSYRGHRHSCRRRKEVIIVNPTYPAYPRYVYPTYYYPTYYYPDYYRSGVRISIGGGGVYLGWRSGPSWYYSPRRRHHYYTPSYRRRHHYSPSRKHHYRGTKSGRRRR